MKIKPLIEGRYYVTVGSNSDYYFKANKHTEEENDNQTIFISRNYLSKGNLGNSNRAFGDYREMTIREIQWFNECIRLNKIISIKDFIHELTYTLF